MEVDKDILQVALAKAITDAVPPEMQKEIFSRAMHQHLFRADQGSKNAITYAFENALNDAVKKLAHEVVQEPENRQKIRAEVQGALIKAFENDALLNKILEKVLRGFGW